MAVRVHTHKSTGETTFSAVYYGPDGLRRVERVRVLKADASKKAREDARLAAAALARERRRAVVSGEWKDPREMRAEAVPKGLTFPEMVKRFLRDYRPRSGDPAFYASRAAVWLAFPAFAKAASAIGPADVERFRNARTTGSLPAPFNRPAGASTIRKDLITLGTMFRWARGRGLVRDNPADRDLVRRPSEPPPRTAYLSERETRAVVKHLAEPAYRRLFLWMIETGMEPKETRAFSTLDVDRQAGIVHAPRSKTSAPRQIPVSPAMAELLDEALKVRPLADGPRAVFLNPAGTGPVSINAFRLALRKAYQAAGLDVRGPVKILRHTFGSRSAMAGLTQPEIQYLMGHRNPVTTSRYIAFSPDHLRDAMRRRSAWAESHHQPHHGETGSEAAGGDGE